MTKQKQHNLTCANCGTEIEDSTPFSKWLRQFTGDHPLASSNVSAQNLDYIWFHYRPGWFITIEEKRFNATPDKSQADAHGVVAQMLTFASGMQCDTLRGKRAVYYRGHFVLSFEKTTPDDSQYVTINEVQHLNPKTAVENLLKTGNVSGVEMTNFPQQKVTDKQGWEWLQSFDLFRLIRLVEWASKEARIRYQKLQQDKIS